LTASLKVSSLRRGAGRERAGDAFLALRAGDFPLVAGCFRAAPFFEVPAFFEDPALFGADAFEVVFFLATGFFDAAFFVTFFFDAFFAEAFFAEAFFFDAFGAPAGLTALFFNDFEELFARAPPGGVRRDFGGDVLDFRVAGDFLVAM
jgi:hypothetical protein